jgi:hypothetical protein
VDLRAKLLSQPPKFTPVTIDDDEFLVKAPTIEERGKLEKLTGVKAVAKGKKTSFDSDPDTVRFLLEALLIMAFKPDRTPLFERADMEALRHCAIGSTVEKLALECLKHLAPGHEKKEDNSEESHSDASSSS